MHACAASASGRPIVTYKPKAREVKPGPAEVPVIHSSAYLHRQAGSAKSAYIQRGQTALKKKLTADEDMSKNAVEWALRRADAYFDKVEMESDANRSARALVKNPATQATMKTMQARSLMPTGYVDAMATLRAFQLWNMTCFSGLQACKSSAVSVSSV
jgi:hypothetical protein